MTTASEVVDRREYVWNTLEEIGANRTTTKSPEMAGRLHALLAVGYIKEEGSDYELSAIGRAFIGGLYGGRSGRAEESPYSKEPERSVWLYAAAQAADVKRRKRRARGKA